MGWRGIRIRSPRWWRSPLAAALTLGTIVAGSGTLTTLQAVLAQPAAASGTVSICSGPDGLGYWQVASDGGVFSYGTAKFYGSMGGQRLNEPIVGMAPSVDGRGYWLVAADGGVFSFGDAPFEGSAGSLHLNSPVVGMVPTVNGQGYWLVAGDGGVFAFGDADLLGSTRRHTSQPSGRRDCGHQGRQGVLAGGVRRRGVQLRQCRLPRVARERSAEQPVVGIAATRNANGYRLTAGDGGVFDFGDAKFYGSMGGQKLNQPVVGIGGTFFGNGYTLSAADGGAFTFGDSAFCGSAGSLNLNQPVVGSAFF